MFLNLGARKTFLNSCKTKIYLTPKYSIQCTFYGCWNRNNFMEKLLKFSEKETLSIWIFGSMDSYMKILSVLRSFRLCQQIEPHHQIMPKFFNISLIIAHVLINILKRLKAKSEMFSSRKHTINSYMTLLLRINLIILLI